MWLVPELRQMRGEGSVRPRHWHVAEQQSDLSKSGDKIIRTGNGSLGRQHKRDDSRHQSWQDIQGKKGITLFVCYSLSK